MQFATELKKEGIEETRVRLFYPRALSYNSLRKALKSGVTKKELVVIKDFECNCDKHKDLHLRTLAAIENENIRYRKCEFTAKTKGITAINSEGKMLLEAYYFYSNHPNWKVRVASVIGLSKFTGEEVVRTLSSMLSDKHWSVKLAVIQALVVIKSEPAKTVLQQIIDRNSQERLKKLACRAVKRSKFGVNFDKMNGPTLHKLLGTTQARKIYHARNKTNKVLVSKKIFHSFLNKDSLQKYFNHFDILHTERKRPFNFVQFNQKNIPVKRHRFTKKNTKKNKINYINNLFFKKVLPIEHFESISNPIVGEIYWAIADSTDPKVTRPLLIVKAINPKAGDFLAMPLTSDIAAQSDDSLLIEIDGKKSTVQISRQRIIHQSLLLNKYGSISSNDLEAICKTANNVKQKTAASQQSYFHKQVKSNRPSVKLDYEKYTADDVPIAKGNTKLKKSKEKTRRIIRLSDFFKPEDYLLFTKAPDSEKIGFLRPKR